MDIIINEHQSSCVVELRGRFDANEVEGFSLAIDRLKTAGIIDYGIVLAAVDFIDSSALAALVSLSRWAAAANGHVELRQPSDPVSVILELTGLDAAFVVQRLTDSSAVRPQ